MNRTVSVSCVGAVVAAAALLFPLHAQAAVVYFDVTATNLSNADSETANIRDNGAFYRSRQTAIDSPSGVVQTAPDTIIYDHHATFGVGIRSTGSAGAAQTSVHTLRYSLAFSIDDPDEVGYTLDVDTLFRAFAFASGDERAYANLGSVYAELDDDPVSGLLLAGTGGSIRVGDDLEDVARFVDNSKSHNLGSFIGSHSFTLEFATTATNLLNNGTNGQGIVHGGIDPNPEHGYPTLPPLTPDGDPMPDLGHFVTVTATFNEPVTLVVPEPASVALLCVGGAGMVMRRSRKHM